jgi:hypothetical protein
MVARKLMSIALAAGAALVSACGGSPVRPVPPAEPVAPVVQKPAGPGWLERSGQATWAAVTLPVRALTPARPKPPVAAEPDPPAELVLVPEPRGNAAPASQPAPAEGP